MFFSVKNFVYWCTVALFAALNGNMGLASVSLAQLIGCESCRFV